MVEGVFDVMDDDVTGAMSPWRRAVFALVIVSLLCAPVSWIDDGITPSWIVYPIVLIVALWRLRGGKGALFVGVAALVFLLVHLPWTYAAITGADENPLDRSSPSSPVQWLITLFAVPLATSAVGFLTWMRERSGRPVEG